MIPEVHIREAALEDIDGMIPLLKELFSIEADFCFDEDLQRRGLKMMLESIENRCLLIASAGDRIIGMASIQSLISTAEGGRCGIVEDVVVTSKWRGKGIGRCLLEAIEAWAHTKGLKRIQLLADATNTPALEFYKNRGWMTTQLICLRKTDIYNHRKGPYDHWQCSDLY
jgi:N-acetylglutamate synthase-like GNAT family acetyltransferase